MSSAPLKKIWTYQCSLYDHSLSLLHLPYFFLSPLILPAPACETVHLTMNSVNQCEFCTKLHCELGRMAGLDDAYKVNEEAMLKTENEIENYTVYAEYGKTFARFHGRGEEVQSKFDAIVSKDGAYSARSARGLCHFLLWGSMGGNTINSFLNSTCKCNMRTGSNVIFEVLFVLYYGPLFLIIKFTSAILACFPSKVPGFVSTVISLVLPTVASIWIVPYALLGVVFRIVTCGKVFEPIKSA